MIIKEGYQEDHQVVGHQENQEEGLKEGHEEGYEADHPYGHQKTSSPRPSNTSSRSWPALFRNVTQ